MNFRPTALVPPALALVALAAAGAVAFGTHPRWAEVPNHGLDVILCSRRLQYVLAGVAMAGCLGIVAMVVAAKRSAWWLATLAAVVALFAQRFAGDTANFTVADEPAFVDAAKADFVKDDDWVVSLKFGDKAYAYPYAALFLEPAVVQVDHDRRLVLFWNAYANRVTAFEASGDWRGRELEVVSTPANSLLVYNAAHGQFVVGVTGLTPDRKRPTGLGNAVPTGKSMFAAWKAANPNGLVMKSGRTPPPGVTPPTRRVDPIYAAAGLGIAGASKGEVMPVSDSASSTTKPTVATTRRRVTVVGTTQPVAIDAAAMSRRPALTKADDRPAVLIRPDDPAAGVRAFSRKVDDQVPMFEAKRDPKLTEVRMADPATGTLWTAAGVAVGGNPQYRGKRLAALPVDEDVDYAVMKWWAADMELFQEPPPPAPPKPAGVAATATTRPARKPKKKPAEATTTRPAVPTRRTTASAGN